MRSSEREWRLPWLQEIHAVPIMGAGGLVRGAVGATIKPLVEKHGLLGVPARP
ncbi:MAG: hypothetical protein ACR2MZ_06330 [Candidatus Dormibacter sp.]